MAALSILTLLLYDCSLPQYSAGDKAVEHPCLSLGTRVSFFPMIDIPILIGSRNTTLLLECTAKPPIWLRMFG